MKFAYDELEKDVKCYKCGSVLNKGTLLRIEDRDEVMIDIKCSNCGWVWFGEGWMWEEDAHDNWILRGRKL